MELKKSVVKSVNKKDMFNELYKFELTMEDGTTGMMYKKSENPFVKIGDEVMFGVNAKGTIKIIPKGQENTPFTPNNKPYVKDTSRDDVIMIQTMLKSSAEYHGKRKDSTINDVMDTAQIWYEFSKSVVSQKPAPAPKPVVIERTKVNDNPF
jgi:hypothetical protein